MVPSSSVALDGDDPNDRARFVTAFHDKVMPFLERQPEFAGTWVDEAHDGRMLVMLTKARDAVVEGVGTRMPANSLGWQAVEVEYSLAELEDSLARVPSVSRAVDPSGDLVGWGIDTKGNRLVLTFTDGTAERMRDQKDQFVERLGVPVMIETSGRPIDIDQSEICSHGGTRTNCWDPTLAGVRIYKDYVGNSDKACTMGFHVYKATADKKNQWLTAGHCTYPGTIDETEEYHSTDFHGGDPLGRLQATLLVSQQKDIARVGHWYASEATDRIFGLGTAIIVDGAGGISDNDTVKFSGASSQDVKQGTIINATYCWYSSTVPGLEVCGARVQAPTPGDRPIGGDSGSPVFRRYTVGDTSHLTPVGIVNAAWELGSGDWVWTFAKVKFILDNYWQGWEVRGIAAP